MQRVRAVVSVMNGRDPEHLQSSAVPSPRSRIRNLTLPPFDPLNARAAELRAAGREVISLGQAVPSFPPPPSALDAARAAIGRPDVNRYATDPGLPGLRSALAARLTSGLARSAEAGHSAGPAEPALRTYDSDHAGFDTSPMKAGQYATGRGASAIGWRDVVITAGANHAFTLTLNTIVDAGDEVIVHAPYFTNHHGAIVAAGATPIDAPVADRETFALRWSDIEPHVTRRTRAVVLCNPSNPTGAPVTAADGEQIVRELQRRDIFVISDETYMHFVYEGAHWSAASAPDWRDNVIVIGTFSKSFGMMGWRVGFIAADGALCTEAVKVQDAMIICAPVISQVAAEAAVRDDWSYPLTFHDEMRARRRLLAEGLATIPRLRWTPTAGGLFGFVRVEACTDSAQLAADLLEQAHVVTIPGAAFGPSGEGHLRISYGYASQPELEEALRRLQAFLG